MALKKLKKGLKKAAKAIVPIGAAILAAKAMGKRKQKPLTPKFMGAGLDSSGAPRTDFVSGDATTAENIANFDRGMDRMSKFTPSGNSGVAYMSKGGRVKGAGVAKRGLGRAFKGGRK